MVEYSDATVIARVVSTRQTFLDIDELVFKNTFRLEIEEVVKGNLLINESIDLYQFATQHTDYLTAVEGDLELEAGKSYFIPLHLNPLGYWQPMMLSYGIYEVVNLTDGNYLLPVPEQRDIHVEQRPDGVAVEPLMVFEKEKLIAHLKDIAEQKATWNNKLVKSSYSVESLLSSTTTTAKAVPSGCNYLGQGSDFGGAILAGFRWQDQTIGVYYSVEGDLNFVPPTNAHIEIRQATDRINDGYLGMNLFDGGTAIGYVPACASGAIGNSNIFFNFANLNLGGPQSIFVQYNDPCGEIPNLNGCAGTLAIGGTYAIGQHNFAGESWGSASYGYVVMNNDILCIGPASYETVVVHELTHALGMSHLDANQFPNNNMNPFCCNDIGTKDAQCMDFMYPPAASEPLAVEFLNFTAETVGNTNILKWQTLTETENQRFEIERAADGFNYKFIGEQKGAGTSNRSRDYLFEDRQPLVGTNYYRIKQIDNTGQYSYSNALLLKTELANKLTIYPNPLRTQIVNVSYHSDTADDVFLEIFDSTGEQVYQKEMSVIKGSNTEAIKLPNLNIGFYIVKIKNGTTVSAKRMVIYQ